MTDYFANWYNGTLFLNQGNTGNFSEWYNGAPFLMLESLPPGEMGGTASLTFGVTGSLEAMPTSAIDGASSLTFSAVGFLGVVARDPDVSTDAGPSQGQTVEEGSQPCANRTFCTGVLGQSDDPDNPISNYSAEDPDVPIFTGIVFPPGPEIGDVFYAAYCLGICRSEISQADADLCALANQYLCISRQQYLNDATTCTNQCGNETKSYTVPAGSFVAQSKAQANALAYQFACTAAQLICSGVPPTSIPTPPTPRILVPSAQQECTVPCPAGGTYTRVLPAAAFWGFSQADADAKAKSYACTLANSLITCFSNLTEGYCEDAEINAVISLSRPMTGTLTWSLLSNLPATIKITFSGAVAQVKGTATPPGTYQFVLRVTDQNGNRVERTYELRVAKIATETPLADGWVDEAYSASLSAEGGYKSPLSWQVEGTLPDGLILNEETGAISGTPTTAGDYTFNIVLQDSAT